MKHPITQVDLDKKENISNRGVPGGYVGLNEKGEVPDTYLPMYDIDAGSKAIERVSYIIETWTLIQLDNPANDDGVLHFVKVWARGSLSGLRVGVFYLVSENRYHCRSSVDIGDVAAGSKRVFPVRLDIQQGDYLGCYYTTGALEYTNSGSPGMCYLEGEHIDINDEEFFYPMVGAISLYGVGVASSGSGDMTKAIYDPDGDGLIAAAQLTGVPTLPLAQSDVTNLITDLGNKTTLAAVKGDIDIADAISKKHANILDHSNSTDHSPGSDNQDLSGLVLTNDVRLSDARTPLTHTHDYEPHNDNIQTHVISAHAPSNAQKNSDITKAEIEAKLTGELSSHTHAGGSGDGEVSIVATGDTPNDTTTLASATGLLFSALANSTYIIEVFLLWNASVATVGIKVSATASGTPTITAGHFMTDATTGTPDSSTWNANSVVVTTSASPFTTYNMGIVNAILKTSGSASTWQLQFAAETTGTITIKAGSVIRYRKVA